MALPVFKIGRSPLTAGGLGSTPRRFRHLTCKRPAALARPARSRRAYQPDHRAYQPPAAMENALSDRASEGKPKSKTMAPATAAYFGYILVCSDGTLYVGSTSDPAQRERTHNEGGGERYTTTRRPVHVVYSEVHESGAAAQKREPRLKRWTRAKKKALIDGDRSRLHVLV